MARQRPYLFCRYQILRGDEAIRPSDEFKLLEAIRGKPIAYRVREPTKDDLDTYLLKPRKKRLSNHEVHTWEVAQDIKYRTATKADKAKDELTDLEVETDEVRHTKFVAVPSLAVFAVDDSFSERTLGARSAVGRFAAVVETLGGKDYEVRVTFAG
jgi:hypothetical protein